MTATPSTKVAADSEYGVVTAPGTLRFERILPGPIDRVWSYLTEPDKLGKWLAAGSTQPRKGEMIELTWDHSQLSPQKEPTPEKYQKYQGTVTRWRITRLEPGRALGFIWDEGTDDESHVSFELEPRDQNVLLVLTHKQLRGREALSEYAGGWHTHLAILSDNLEGRTPRPFWSTHAAVQAEYAKRAQADGSWRR